MEEITRLLSLTVTDRLYQIIISNPRNGEKGVRKVKIRPVMVKNEILYQETMYTGTQVIHRNHDREKTIRHIIRYIQEDFKQCEIVSKEWKAVILVSKKGKITVKKTKVTDAWEDRNINSDLSHNRIKKYILEEGKPVSFLVDLGVQTEDGRIIKAKYDKFRQINRYLEFIRDIMPKLPGGRIIRIIDFGCGKSYLTFALYYYLHEMHKLPIQVTGLDLKEDVIEHCNGLAKRYGYEGLHFVRGDIADFEGADNVDMVVTLHACDTATDHALKKAVEWGAGVILAVPCCQHEVNNQLDCKQLAPLMKYGIIKERTAALFTDAIRANLLEGCGYEVQILEFIDMEHTPKNILIRAVKGSSGKKDAGRDIRKVTGFLQVETTLQKLLS